MRTAILAIIAILYGGINFYIGNKVRVIIQSIIHINFTIPILVIFIALYTTTIITYYFASYSVGDLVGKIGLYWFGFSLTAFVLLLLSEATAVIIYRGFLRKPLSSTYIVIGLCCTCIIYFYGIYNARHLDVTTYEVSIDKKSAIDSLEIVMISDLHLGYINDNKYLEKAIERINQLSPDIVVIVGDLFDGNFSAITSPLETINLFNSIDTKYGTYMCWGNHDAGKEFDKMKEFIMQTNITLLEDRFTTVDDKFVILGRKDSSPIGNQGVTRSDENINYKEINKKLPLIVLDHQPTNILHNPYEADLILMGHTHAGQIFPFNLVTNKVFVSDYGYYQLPSSTQTIVTSGLGTWGPPMRIGSKNEIVKITVKFNNKK